MKHVLLILVMLAAGCGLYPKAVEVTPKPEYREYWDELIECTKCKPRISFDSLRVFEYVKLSDRCWLKNVWGCWMPPDRIYIVRNASESMVKHEMLHAMLHRIGHGPEWECVKYKTEVDTDSASVTKDST